MTEVISKLQYKEFEKGEFIDEKARTFSECQKIIEEFPWEKERESLKVSLTNPSITFEKQKNNFLKLSTSYNQKFILNYYNESQELYSKNCYSYVDSFPFIEQYFVDSTFDTKEFKKENIWMRNIRQHFETQTFIFQVTPNSAFKYLFRTSWISFCLPILISLIFIFMGHSRLDTIGYLSIAFVIFFVGGGLNIVLFLNHYFWGKYNKLILSRGNDNFHFGNKQTIKMYSKNDILKYTTFRHHSYRSPINEFAVLKIEFKNGEILKLSSILLDHYSWERKLYKCIKVDKNRLPFQTKC